MSKKLEKELLDAMAKDPGNWRGFIYFNRKDPRIIVPKMIPALGWTFNFASPYAYITLIAVMLIVLATVLI
jgi:uncharacterized membrane protein